MTQRILALIISIIIKSVLLYFVVLIGSSSSLYFLLFRFLIYFLITGWLDYNVLRMVRRGVKNPTWILLLSYSYSSYIIIVWIAEVVFELYNASIPIQEMGRSKLPLIAFILYVSLGFVTSALITAIITIRINKRMNKSGRSHRPWRT